MQASPAVAAAAPAASSSGFSADPFGDVFDAPKPPPAQPIAVASPAPASVNPFEDLPPQPPVAPTAAVAPPASVPDEFDLFLASTTQQPPAAAAETTAATSSMGGGADPEFDAFLASLEKK